MQPLLDRMLTRALVVAALAMIGAGCEAPDSTDTGAGSASASSSGSGGPALTGQRVYLAERTSIETGLAASISPFDVAEDGRLVPVAGAPFPLGNVGTGHNMLHAEACGGFLYVATDDHGVGATSVLGFKLTDSGAPVFVNANASDRTEYLECYEDKFLYAISDSSVLAYTVSSSGALQSTTGHIPVDSLARPGRLEARGGHVFALAPLDAEVRVYGLDKSSGALSHPPEGPSWPQTLSVISGSASPDGKWFAWTDVAASQPRNVLHVSSIGADGALVVVPPAEIVDPADPLLTEVAWVGSHLLVVSHSPTQVRSYDVSPQGDVTIPAVSVLELDPHFVFDIVVDDSKSRAFLLMATDDLDPQVVIVVLNVSASGILTLAPGSPLSVGTPSFPQLLLH